MNIIKISGRKKSGRTTIAAAYTISMASEEKPVFFWSHEADFDALGIYEQHKEDLPPLWLSGTRDVARIYGDIALFVHEEHGETIILDGVEKFHHKRRERLFREIECVEKKAGRELRVVVTEERKITCLILRANPF